LIFGAINGQRGLQSEKTSPWASPAAWRAIYRDLWALRAPAALPRLDPILPPAERFAFLERVLRFDLALVPPDFSDFR
jgi:hypothetical protein